MRNVWAVIKREYLQRVRSKWFVFATVAGPLLMLAAVLVPVWVESRDDQADARVSILDRTGVLEEGVRDRLEGSGMEVVPLPDPRESPDPSGDDAVLAALLQKVSLNELNGFLLLDDETLRSGRAEWHGRRGPSAFRALALRQAVASAALEAQLADRGLDVGALLSGGELEMELLGEGGGSDDATFFLGFVGAFLLYMVILLYAVAVMRSTLEEKTSRVVEVVISAMDPWHLMLGKILGVGAVGLTQLAVWAVAAALLAGSGVPMLLAMRPEIAELGDLGSVLPGAGLLAVFVGLFVFGYFIYSGLYAAVGAMCNSDEEAQQAQLPVIVLVIGPMVILPAVLENPDGPLATALSLFPFFTPVLMWPRIAAGAAPAWQVAAGFALMALTVVGVAWLAGRIYKVGILMAGKRPTLPELWRWVREA